MEDRGHKIAGKLVRCAKGCVSALSIVLCNGDNNSNMGLFEAASKIACAQFPVLQSFSWTGDVTHRSFSGLPFALQVLNCDLSMEDYIEVLSACTQLTAFSNFEPTDHASALAMRHPPTRRCAIMPPQRGCVGAPNLTSLSMCLLRMCRPCLWQ